MQILSERAHPSTVEAAPGAEPASGIAGSSKRFRLFHALKNINVTVQASERNVFYGLSEPGKSTPVRCINP